MTTSPKQAAVRANSGHISVLARLSDGLPAFGTDVDSMGTLRGRKTIMATLRRWNAINDEGITTFGSDVLAAWHERFPARV